MTRLKIIDTSGETCPMPLVKARRGIDMLKEGETLLVIGTDPSSKPEIIMAAAELGTKVLKVETDKSGKWQILIKK